MDNYSKHQQKIKQYAENIIKMEDSYDESMEGAFLDSVVTEYINQKAKPVIDIIEKIFTEHKSYDDFYGDDDMRITTFDTVKNTPKVENIFKNKPDPDVVWSALQFQDNCGSNDFIIIKEKTDKGFIIKEKYFIYNCQHEPMKTVDYKKIIEYGDFRDPKYVMAFKTEQYSGDVVEFEILENRYAMKTYKKFQRVLSDLRNVEYSLEDK